ncbi:bile acid:sodium symporter family protein [Stieleria varia]|uniref:Sodium Bile acid symporter family protein n=1 Tax=Stieleria varia TaxID=2528005 RepID=A0A5C6A4U1_9BACT|nr:bile acid:sodium symporter [Stieleria varia]TWT94456.1 Sodium Bile acid symporter family protein [Stieleria varia]
MDFDVDFIAVESYLSIAILVTSTIGMGATLTLREFAAVCRMPQGIIAVTVAQVVISPLLAIGLSRLFQLPAGVAFGLLLVAAMPGGLFSNLLTHLGGGNVALSITATSVSTLLCLLSTSLLLRLYGASQLPADFAMPMGRIFLDILLYVLMPLFAGLTIRRVWPHHAPRFSRIFVHLSSFLLGCYILSAFFGGRLEIFVYGWQTPLALTLFGAGSLWSGILMSFAFRLPPNDRFAISIESVFRNAGLALLLKAAIFPAVDGLADPIADGVLYVILFYMGVSLAIGIEESTAKRLGIGFLYPKPEPQESDTQKQETRGGGANDHSDENAVSDSADQPRESHLT